MKPTSYLYFTIILCSCSNNKNDFKEYISSVKQIPFPISFNTSKYADRIMNNKADSLLVEKYKPIDANEIFGKLYENEESVGMIYTVYGDAITPILMTYNKDGMKMDSLNLFENASGYNPEKETYVTITINQPNKIKELDSTNTWKLNSNQERVDSSVKLNIDSAFYLIQDDGKIIKK
jgi:hypothetical protein